MKKLHTLPHDEFLKSFILVPRIAINLLIKERSRFLLTKRPISPLKGYWHIPGSFLLKNEKISDCILRIVKDELGIHIKLNALALLGVFEDLEKDPRGHVIDIVYICKIDNQSKLRLENNQRIVFFNKIPEKIGFGHEKILQEIVKKDV